MRSTKLWCLAAAVATMAIAGCSRPTILLWTDNASTAHVAEEFNAHQDRYVVDLVYYDDLSSALRLEPGTPDLVVGSYIEDLATARLFMPLDRLMGTDIDPSIFYADLLATGQRNGRQLLLPLAFDLPLIYYAGASPAPEAQIVVSPQQIRDAGEAFNEGDENRWTTVGFSPRWSGEYLYQHLRFLGFQARERADSTPEWSQERLQEGLDDVADWIETANGGIGRDIEFQERYLYDPYPQLIRSGRIRFAFDSASHYFEQSDEYRSRLSYLWLGEQGRIEALESVTYVGIPERSDNHRGAAELVKWLFDEERQSELLKTGAQKRLSAFGIIGGFSSLWRVNEEDLTTGYPALDGRMPPADWIRFAPPSPRHWSALRQNVVIPWLVKESAGIEQSRDLANSVRAWLLQQEE